MRDFYWNPGLDRKGLGAVNPLRSFLPVVISEKETSLRGHEATTLGTMITWPLWQGNAAGERDCHPPPSRGTLSTGGAIGRLDPAERVQRRSAGRGVFMARVTRLDVYQRLLDEALVPIFHHADPEVCCHVVSAVAAGGAGLFEFTNRGDQAVEAFRAAAAHASRKLPRMVLGAGSIVDEPTAALYIAQGARFIVGPSYSERVARLCNRRRIAYLPGCQTATEIATAEELGMEIIKLFPAQAAGGPGFINQLLGPAPATRILATGIGEVSVESLAAWFKAGACGVGLGRELIQADLVAAGDYEAIARRVAEVRELVRRARTG